MRVLVTRPARDAATTAARLKALGHDAIISPVTRIVATGAAIPPGPFDALVVTSSNAIECLDDDAASRLRDLPLVCVGERTRDIAARRGFDAAQAPAADVAALIAALRARPAGTRFLYLAGRDRKPSLESALQNMGHVVATSDVYEARAELSLTPETIAALRQGAIDAAFNFSRRSSELLIELSRSAGVLADLGRVAQICISGDAAEPLRLLGARVIVADAPTSVGLFAALDFV